MNPVTKALRVAPILKMERQPDGGERVVPGGRTVRRFLFPNRAELQGDGFGLLTHGEDSKNVALVDEPHSQNRTQEGDGHADPSITGLIQAT